MTPEQAEIFALQALTFLAGDEKMISALQAQSGFDPDSLKDNLGNPALLGAILDFLLEDERRLVACCEANEWELGLIGQVRRALPGNTSGIWQ